MSKIHEDLAVVISKNTGFINTCNSLFEAYIKRIVKKNYDLDNKQIRQLASALQYFYLSNNDTLVSEAAVILSMLLYLYGDTKPELLAIADSVYSAAGDFPNVALLKSKFQDYVFNPGLMNYTARNLRQKLNKVDEIEHTLTDYQRTLWEHLSLDRDVITAAPTSTGKTHIVLHYLISQLINSEYAFAVAVVPTRALISELAKKIYSILKSESQENAIEICTIPKEGNFSDRSFFIMTQERLFELLQIEILEFNYLFIDEAHNISDKNRGVLLHLTLEKVLEDSNPQLIVSMPSELYRNAFGSVFNGVNFYRNMTNHSPVSKIVMCVKCKGTNLLIKRNDKEHSVIIKKEFNGKKLSNIVFRLGQGEGNIIYQNRTNDCEKVANEIATLIPNALDSKALDEAADYVERFLHKDFSLANNLRKGVAFHYGPLPSTVRTMIEEFARSGDIQYVVCTSTLAEGVNLPAKNLFLKNPAQQIPYKPSEKLETVKINNITGRAGRMLEHFAGNIFLIEPESWTFKDYFELDDEADKIPTYYKILNEYPYEVINALNGIYSFDKDDQYTYYTIANKLIKEYAAKTLSKTFEAPEIILNETIVNDLLVAIRRTYENLTVDPFTLETNPTIGYIQQSKLHKYISERSDIAEWVLPHPKTRGLYSTLVRVCLALHHTGIFLPKESVERVCVIAKKWMIGDPINSIIANHIKHATETDQNQSVNKSVRSVIKIIDTDVRFRLSTALRCYKSLVDDILGEREDDTECVGLHYFIEVGGCEERLISLIGLGLSRETALEVERVLHKAISISAISDIKRCYDDGLLISLHPITLREIANVIS